MPWKDMEKQRAAVRQHYYANRQIYIDKAIKRRKEIREWLNNIKEASPCADCKSFYPYYVMDFDHIGLKNKDISRLVKTGGMRSIKKELEHCELVCSNCHRIRTHNRFV